MTDPKPDPKPLALEADFPASTEAEWRKLVDGVLKGAAFDKRLVSQTYDGLRIEPLYPRARDGRPVAGHTPGAAWTIMQRIDHPDPKAANAQLLDDLENGATGVTLVFKGSLNANGFGLDPSPETLARVLDGVALDAGIAIDFNLSRETRAAVDNFVALVNERKLPPSSVDLRASLNPIGGLAATGSSPKPWRALAKDFAAAVRDLAEQGFRGPLVVADGRIIHNAGGSEAQELAFAIATAVECLRALEASGLPLDAARSLTYFRLATDADQFLTMAKFRSIRKLWARVEVASGLTPKPTIVAAETAWRMMTRRDPYANMLRTAIAVAAAGLGGADNIAALPHTAAIGLPDGFARRAARNTQLVLLQESHLAAVADPAAGSGALEDLTDKICRAAWSLFQEFEAAGGAWASLEQGLIQREVAAVRAARAKAVARRKDALTGTTEYPNLQEQPAAVVAVAPAAAPRQSSAGIEPLPSIRLAEPFEALRDKSDRALATKGARPKVFLANLGKLSEFSARAAFAKNFYEAGGIEAPGNEGFPDRAAMLAAFGASGAKLACLCSSDKVYETKAADAAKALKAAGAIVQLAGRPRDNEATWREAGVKDFIFVGCDVLSTLQAAHDSLGVS
jgi:methylmalonyl-CoA mutase